MAPVGRLHRCVELLQQQKAKALDELKSAAQSLIQIWGEEPSPTVKCRLYKVNCAARTHTVSLEISNTVVVYSLIFAKTLRLFSYSLTLASSLKTKIVQLQEQTLTKRKRPTRPQLCESAELHHAAPVCQMGA